MKKLHTSAMLFVAIICLVVSALIGVKSLWLDHLKLNVQTLLGTALVNSGLVLVAVFLLNWWSTRIANGLAVIGVVEPGCGYCGEPGKKLVCGQCDSILWYKIKGWGNKIGFFYAHRRYAVSGLLLTAFFVTPLTFTYQQIAKKEEDYVRYEQKAMQFRTSLNDARGLLLSLENLETAFPRERIMEEKFKLMERFQSSYRVASWMAMDVFDYFAWEKVESSRAIKPVVNSIKMALEKLRGVPDTPESKTFRIWPDSSLIAKRLAPEKELTRPNNWNPQDLDTIYPALKSFDIIKKMDEIFQDYVKASDQYFEYAYLTPKPDSSELMRRHKLKCIHAHRFYQVGRVANCYVFHLAFDSQRVGENSEVGNKYGCREYLMEYEAHKDWYLRPDTCCLKCFTKPPSALLPNLTQASGTSLETEKKSRIYLFDVVAADFESNRKAQAAKSRMRKAGHQKARVIQMKGAKPYRLVVGKGLDRLHADALVHSLRKFHGFPKAAAVSAGHSKTTKSSP